MWSGSVAYYEADHADSVGTVLPKQFPGLGLTTPQEPLCCGNPGDRCPSSGATYSDPIWEALSFIPRDPHYFRPMYTVSGVATAALFTGATYGDLDCDGIYSTFQRVGAVDLASGDVAAGAAYYTDKETE
jgi:hypothetical protein